MKYKKERHRMEGKGKEKNNGSSKRKREKDTGQAVERKMGQAFLFSLTGGAGGIEATNNTPGLQQALAQGSSVTTRLQHGLSGRSAPFRAKAPAREGGKHCRHCCKRHDWTEPWARPG